jgi:hypothetical protein
MGLTLLTAVFLTGLPWPVAAAVAAPTVPADLMPAAPNAVTATDVSFNGSGAVVLHGTVLAPRTPAPGPRGGETHPGLVMLEGAGNRGRGYLMPEAQEYARHGIVTLVYDKRTVGYSLFHRDYSVLADDALAGVRLLRARQDVDPARVGLWALSEGAFVAPLAAEHSDDVAFLITVGAVAITPAAQTSWAYGEYLGHRGISGSLPRILQHLALPVVVGAGLFPEASFDPIPAWQSVHQPVLAEWGELDRDSLPGRSSRLIDAALTRGGNLSHTIRIVPAVNHDLHVTADDGFDHLTALPADYADYEAAWIDRFATTGPFAGPAEEGRLPADEPSVPDVAPPAWYDAAWAQVATVTFLLLAFMTYPAVGALQWLRHRDRRTDSRGTRRHTSTSATRSARWLAVLGPVTVLGTVAYLFFLLATAAMVIGPVVLGRPVLWLSLQLCALATVAAATLLVIGCRSLRAAGVADRIRLGALVSGGLVFLPWAIHWCLLLP